MGLESWSLRDQPQSSDWLPLPYSKNHLQPAVRVSSDSFFSTSQVFAPWNKNTMPGVRNQCLEWECICGDYEQLPLSSIRRLCYLFARNFSHMWISLKKKSQLIQIASLQQKNDSSQRICVNWTHWLMPDLNSQATPANSCLLPHFSLCVCASISNI